MFSRRKVGDKVARQARNSMACTAGLAPCKSDRLRNCHTASHAAKNGAQSTQRGSSGLPSPSRAAQVMRHRHSSRWESTWPEPAEEGEDQPDRDAQFGHINTDVKKTLAAGMPVISVDTKKKELVGNYDNAGQQWLPAKQSLPVNGHDFPSPEVPQAYPYGIYDLGRNTGFVNVGTDYDSDGAPRTTLSLVVPSIRESPGFDLNPSTSPLFPSFAVEPLCCCLGAPNEDRRDRIGDLERYR